MKLVVNLMVAVSAGMLGEALALGEKTGLDWQQMLDVIDASAVASPFVKYKVPLLRTRDFSPQFTAQLMAKDLSLILAAAERAGADAPLAKQTLDAFRRVADRGWEQEDMMAILKVYERARSGGGDD